MKRKLIAFLVLISCTSVHAGVVNKLVEVDAAERERLEQQRIREQEAYRQAAEDQKSLKTEISQEEVIAKAHSLREKELNELASQLKPATTELAAKPDAETTIPTTCETCAITKYIGSALGVATALPLGSVAGLFRGAASKGIEYSDDLSADMGYGTTANIVGRPAGALGGGIAGAITGLIKGAKTGVVKGWTKPFSRESFSLDGDKFTDWNPFEI